MMQEPLSIIVARKFPFLRKFLLRRFYGNKGIVLQDLIPVEGGRFYLYKIDDTYFPNETLHEHISFENLLVKAKNESLFQYTPGSGDVIIDLGAGLGEETIVYSRLAGEKGHVYAFEPFPAVFHVLEKMIRLNRLQNVSAHNIAIGPADDFLYMKDIEGSYESIHANTQNGEHKIAAKTLSGIIRDLQIDKIDLLKANIEGSERFLIETLDVNDFKKIRHVAIACHDFRYRKEGEDFFRTREMVKLTLLKNGFRILERQTGIDYLDDWVYGSNNFI